MFVSHALGLGTAVTSVRILYHSRGDRLKYLSTVDQSYKTTWLYIPTCRLANNACVDHGFASRLSLCYFIYIYPLRVANSLSFIRVTAAHLYRSLIILLE